MKRAFLFMVIFAFSWLQSSGSDTLSRHINWQGLKEIQISDGVTGRQLYFDGAQYMREHGDLPVYSERIELASEEIDPKVRISNPVFQVIEDDLTGITGLERLADSVIVHAGISLDRKVPYLFCSFVPLRINPYNGNLESLVSFDLVIDLIPNGKRSVSDNNFKPSSVLGSGNWYKFSVQETGVYRITYNDLQAMGLDPGSLDPRNIRIYGNGGGMLHESLAVFRYDDLEENAIQVIGEEDGRFDQQDYILFYGESPHYWYYNDFTQQFNHVQNIYSDHTFYFLTPDLGSGKRISSQPSSTENHTVEVTQFTDYVCHELDLYNLVSTGRIWYGEIFDEPKTSYDFNYSFPGLVSGAPATLKAFVAAKSTASSSFSFYNGSDQIMTATITGIPSSSETFARNYVGSETFYPTGSSINLRINYQKSGGNSIGWLNYFELNVKRGLSFTGGQMPFREPSAASPGAIARYVLGNAGAGVTIWNVTDPLNIRKVETASQGNARIMKVPNDSIQEFLAYDGTVFKQVAFVEKVPNQNIHASGPHDLIIITHPLFRDEAERLAAHHRANSGLTVLVVDIFQVYNEFSSGAQDLSAIRDYMKYLYETASDGNEPRYLLLFGDASFDFKDRIEDNSNFIPTWEDEESLTIVYSVVTDDYFGFLDGPGDNMLDIGIGRLPVETVEQASAAVDKIIDYSTNTERVMHEWRNYVTFVADDEDGNLHLNQAEQMATFLDTTYAEYTVDKIYVDAFYQTATPAGQRVPDVNAAINSRMEKGTLIMNYTGHGGEVGWGHERFLEISDINSWSNADKLPVFITATCEFSRYDDPKRVSAGEMVFRNPSGGAVAMFTTARATFGGSNFNLNTALFNVIFEGENDENYRFGDMIRLAKNKNGVVENDKKFVLLGDPALQLAIPEKKAVITSINGVVISNEPDTLNALSQVTIRGEIQDENGSRVSNFNGTMYPIVYDKPSVITTFGADESSKQTTFNLRNNILYKGKAGVTGGEFEFSFIVPKDIAYKYGFGKISFYSRTSEVDAHGCYENIIVGGFNNDIEPDDAGPIVEMFMNDQNFKPGGITDQNPLLLAFVSDESGINTVGSGIGHDITAVVDGNYEKPLVLNEYYESELNSFKEGTIQYPFFDLEEGWHSISLKVWDVFNNSGEGFIEFLVVRSENLTIDKLLNYPNPFMDGTSFVFEHNYPETKLDILINIFNLAGQSVIQLRKSVEPDGYRIDPIYWNGRDSGGNKLRKGMYIYRVVVRASGGATAEKTGKLVILD